ncbi:heterokaryon incompatibility protein-domain-containing protein, partial [Flammula alnicola]
DHDRCSKLDETYLPTRVIDCSDPSKPRLFETHRQIKGYYCTLSYVWGGEQHQKTTAANIDTYVREGINVPLPQTIADAIFVTHKLGVRYLWVDALCIIQDSFEDKVKELANMGRIYRDSSLTISVLSAYRADEGFLPDERTSVVSLGRMLLKYDIPRQDPSLGYKHQTVATHSPLDERGWCLQESILSPRRLIFQPPYVQYKCRSFSQNFTPDRWEKETASGYSQSDYILFTIAKDTSASGGGVADDKLRERWEQILSSYTRCKITVPNDKLVALAGVAEVFQSISQDDYLAGLWRRTLLNDLLWKPFGPIGPDEVLPPRPVEYRAPTWSWASVGDVVINPHRKHMFEDPSTEYEAEILACEVTPKSSIHPLGEVEEATLTVEAKIRPLMLDGQKCTFMERKGTRTGDVFQSVSLGGDWVAPVGNCLESGSSSVDRLGGEGQEKKRIGIRFDCLEGTAQDRPMDFFVIILRAGRRWGNREGYRDEGWMRGLLVLRVEDDVEQYRRVAKLDLQYNFQWPDWFDTTPLKTVTLV